MIEELTLVLVQAVHNLHVVGTEFKVKNVDVFSHPGLVNGLWNNHDSPLEQPTQNYLAIPLAVLLTNLSNGFVGEDIVLSFRKWCPGFGLDVLLLVKLHRAGFLEPW